MAANYSTDRPVTRYLEAAALLFRATFWFALLGLLVYFLLKYNNDLPSIIDVGIAMLFSISGIFIVLAIRPPKESGRKSIDFSLKDWVTVRADARYFSLLAAVISSGLGIWFTHVENESVRNAAHLERESERQASLEKKKLELQDRLAVDGQRPGYVTEDEWNLTLGVRSYQSRDYDKALEHFGAVRRLDRETDFVRWKFYECMTKMRILEHRKFIQLEPVDLKVVQQISGALSELERRFPLDKNSESVLYWHGQLKLQFEEDYGGALDRFKKVIQDYKYGQWRQGALLYSAEILSRTNEVDKLKQAEENFQALVNRYPTALVRIVDEGVDRRVEEVVPEKLQKVRERIAALGGSPSK